MPYPQIAATRDPTEEHTVVSLIGIGDCGRHALELFAIHTIPYVETMACDALDGDVRAFMAEAHLLFLVFDPDEATGLNTAVAIATLFAETPDVMSVAISVRPTAWPDKLGAVLTLPKEEFDKSLLLTAGGLAAILRMEGYISLDFVEVCMVLAPQAICLVGIGKASGVDRGTTAAHQALQQIEDTGFTMTGATGVILMLSAAMGSLKQAEHKIILTFIRGRIDPNCYLIYGNYYDDALGDAIRVTVIASRAQDSSSALS